ncbi:thioredoxin domain-containing protein [Novosphingobium colocasiae]|uniref:thioredoxin domain-containing protein n=1 Tax=Novosphingobium colocasiae TaxID=1256513 RepID=UPI0035B4A42A
MMRASTIRPLAFGLALVPLALALSACGKKDDAAPAALASGDPVAKIAAPAGKAWADMVDVTPDGGYRLGNPEAPIKLIEYGSLSCPHCAKFTQDGHEELVNDFIASGRVSWEFRSFAIHPQDVPLTMLVTCSGKEAVFPLVQQVYLNFDAMNAPLADKAVQDRANAVMQLPAAQRLPGMAEALGYTQFFAQRGIAVDQANKCLGNVDTAKQIAEFSDKYTNDGITGTPTLLVNGSKVDSTEWEETKAALKAAGAR